MNESVGKKIVEALKRQAEVDMTVAAPASVPSFQPQKRVEVEPEVRMEPSPIMEEAPAATESFNDIFADNEPLVAPKTSVSDDAFDTMSGFGEPSSFQSMAEPTAFEMPSNIVVLKKLISQLPSGVSRHTGAQIIKQTMEALGISMRSVLQDAQQVQENLKTSAKECQSYIQEYKKQIISLEKQSQNYQKQYAALNDLISLFIQANK